MGDSDNLTFSADDAVAAQRALRQALGLPEERFPAQAFVSMISDEIEQMRAQGRTDQEVADVIRTVTGHDLPASFLADNYAAPDTRQQPGTAPKGRV